MNLVGIRFFFVISSGVIVFDAISTSLDEEQFWFSEKVVVFFEIGYNFFDAYRFAVHSIDTRTKECTSEKVNGP